MKTKKPLRLVNYRNHTEVWICENYNQRRLVDGVEFIEVYKPEQPTRRLWVNINTLTKSK